MATYECSKCGMGVNATCAKCDAPLVDDILKLEDGTEVQIRSMYDDTYVYFLAEWKDSKQDASRETWYFDPSDKRWKQGPNLALKRASDVQ